MHGLVLCFDYGLRQIGIAVGETLTQSARPLATIAARDGVPNWSDVEKILAEYKPQLLVIGLPLDLDGNETEMCARARKFANRLHGRFGLQVALHDERFSSKEAKAEHRAQAAENFRKHGRQQKSAALDAIDADAAALILSSYLAGLPDNSGESS